jgi:hypothetical protein
MASSFERAANSENDPDNRYLWRFRPQRLEAEIVRDSMLAAGGNINLAIGGEPIFPLVPKEILAGQFRGKWETTPEGPAAWRRGVYVYRRRSLPYPMFDTFDHPDMNVTAGARNVSTVPTQALTLLNNPFVLSQAEWLADRVSRETSDPLEQIDRAHRIALARPPAKANEMAIATDLIRNSHHGIYARAAQSRRVRLHGERLRPARESESSSAAARGINMSHRCNRHFRTAGNSCSVRAAGSAVWPWRTARPRWVGWRLRRS